MLLLSRAKNVWNGHVARVNMICSKSVSVSLPHREWTISRTDSCVARANMIYSTCVAMSLLPEVPRWAES